MKKPPSLQDTSKLLHDDVLDAFLRKVAYAYGRNSDGAFQVSCDFDMIDGSDF